MPSLSSASSSRLYRLLLSDVAEAALAAKVEIAKLAVAISGMVLERPSAVTVISEVVAAAAGAASAATSMTQASSRFIACLLVLGRSPRGKETFNYARGSNRRS